MRNRKNNLNLKFDRLHNDIYMDEGMQFSISGHSPLGLFPAETLKDTDVIKVATTPMPVLFYLSFWFCLSVCLLLLLLLFFFFFRIRLGFAIQHGIHKVYIPTKRK